MAYAKKMRSRPMLTFEEARAYLNCTEPWLRRRIRRREIRYTKYGNYVMFDQAWLEEFIASNVVEPVQ